MIRLRSTECAVCGMELSPILNIGDSKVVAYCHDCVWYSYRWLVDSDLADRNPFAVMLIACLPTGKHLLTDENGESYYRSWKEVGSAMCERKLRLPLQSNKQGLTEPVISCYAGTPVITDESHD